MTNEEWNLKVDELYNQAKGMSILPEQQIKVMGLIHDGVKASLERGTTVFKEVREEVLSDLNSK